MATIYLTLSTKVDASEKQEILLRFSHGKINQRAKSNIFIHAKFWDNDKQEIKVPNFRMQDNEKKELIQNLTTQQGKLLQLKKSIAEAFNETDKKNVSTDWLIDYVDKFNQRGKYATTTQIDTERTFFSIVEEFFAKYSFSEGRQIYYRAAFSALQRFATLQKTVKGNTYFVLDIHTFNADILKGFEDFLVKEHTFYEEFPDFHKQFGKYRKVVPRSINTVAANLKKISTFFNWCNSNKITQNQPFANYTRPSVLYGTPYYLSIDERNKLYNFDLSKDVRLEQQRDIFVFQCLIGCRVGDLLGFKKSNVINGAIEYVAGKTKTEKPKTLRVPLNKIATEILAKYAHLRGESLLPFVEVWKYNEAIREAFTIAEITRNVTILNPRTRQSEIKPLNEIASSHLARRTFCGNLYKKVKDPNLVGSLSGHAEGSTAFARYRDIDEEMKMDLVKMIE